jgi:hypothetical protein
LHVTVHLRAPAPSAAHDPTSAVLQVVPEKGELQVQVLSLREAKLRPFAE